MKIYNLYRNAINLCISENKILTKKIKRIALNSLIIGNCCLVTSLFFVASKVILAVALTISIIGSSLLIDRCYK